MPKTKISEFSATAGNNTDIDGINISEGCPPSGINDAIRELMAQLKDFQAGTAGDSFNGPVGTTTPAAGAFTNFSASGTFALTGDQVQISEGGTGQTTANAAFNALAPSQSTHAGKYLKTDGTNTSWDAIEINTADITGTLPIANGGTGLTALGTGVQTALGIAVGSAGAFVVNGGALGTPSSGTVTNLTGTASININGTVGATTPTTGAFTTLSASGNITVSGGTANGVAYLNGSKVLTTGSALTFDATNGFVTTGGASVRGTSGPSTGVGLEITYGAVASTARLLSYDRDAAARKDIQLDGLNLLFNANGSEGMRLTSTGLGIGTSSPSYRLQVTGNANAFRVDATNSATDVIASFAGRGVFGIDAPGVSNGRFIVTDAGNVGIGTSSPGTKLQITSGAVRVTAESTTNSSNAGYRWSVKDSGGNVGNSGIYVEPTASINGRYFGFAVDDSTYAMVLNNSGNLGIGTSSPGSKLDVSTTGDTLTRVISGATNLAYTRFTNGTQTTVIGQENSSGSSLASGTSAYASVFGTNSAYSLQLATGNIVRATLDSSGNLGLGVTPSAWSAGQGFEMKNGGAIASQGSSFTIAANTFFASGTGWTYKTSSSATRYDQSSGAHQWYTAPSGTAGNAISFTQALTLNANGALVLQGGNTSASGVGVAFPATQSASSDANTLDDYEEGTWTPVLATDGTNFTSVSYAIQTAKYTKIGNQVTIAGTIYTSAVTKGSASGNVIITGLPFAQPSTDARGGVNCFAALLWLADTPISGEITTSQINLYKRATSNGATSNVAVADVGTSANSNFVRFQGSYFV